MRWVLVARHAHPSRSGVGAANALFLHAASRAGWDVELVTEAPVPVPRGVRVTVVRAAREPAALERLVPELRRLETIRPLRYERWALAAARELARRRRTVDGVEFPDAEGSAWIAQRSAAVRAQLGGASIIVHAHTPMFLEDAINAVPVGRFGRARTHARECDALRTAEGVLAASGLLARRLERDLGVDALVAPYPLLPIEPSAHAECLASDPSERVVFVGSLQPRKGIDLLVEAMRPLLLRHARLRVDCIGPDTTATPLGTSVRAAIERRVPPAVRERLRFLGPRSHAGVRRMMASAHLVVVPSRFDAFSLAAAEAVLLERPLVLCEDCGILESMPHVQPVPRGDVAELGAAIERTLLEPPAREVLAARRAGLLQACAPEHALAARRALVERARMRSGPHGLVGEGADDGVDATIRSARELAGLLRQARRASKTRLGTVA